jgi:hypothetical protein
LPVPVLLLMSMTPSALSSRCFLSVLLLLTSMLLVPAVLLLVVHCCSIASDQVLSIVLPSARMPCTRKPQ